MQSERPGFADAELSADLREAEILVVTKLNDTAFGVGQGRQRRPNTLGEPPPINLLVRMDGGVVTHIGDGVQRGQVDGRQFTYE